MKLRILRTLLWLLFLLLAVAFFITLWIDDAEKLQSDQPREFEQAVSLRPSSKD